VQGFGAVGTHAARFLSAQGAVVIGVADSQGTLFHPQGIDVARLIALKNAGHSVLDYPDGEKLARHQRPHSPYGTKNCTSGWHSRPINSTRNAERSMATTSLTGLRPSGW
jgi:Glutamate/Leucine/Phenylalanine/Valine dehydrogenase